jgi:c-di-GMP-binding flagellar brake protein YcgR
MYSEKRRGDRIPRKSSVKLIPYSALAPDRLLTAVEARLEDVSPTGICAIADAELLPTARVRVKIELEATGAKLALARAFEVDAEVMWTQPLHEEGPYRTGLKFVNASKLRMEQWKSFCAKARPSLY